MILKQKTLLGFVLSSLFILSSPLARGEQNPIQTKDIINDKTSPVIDRKQQLNQGNPYDIGVIKFLDPNSGVYNRPIWLNPNDAGEYPRSTDDTAYLCRSALRVSRNLEEILSACPRIANALIWEDETGVKNWFQWSQQKKDSLNAAYIIYFNHYNNSESSPPSIFNDPPPFQTSRGAGYNVYYYSRETAWDIYRSYVAQSIAIEISGRLSWSILDYNSEDLARLFDGRKIWLLTPVGYTLWYSAIPGIPTTEFSFLIDNNLIANSRAETISRVLNWGRSSLTHILDGSSETNNMYYWDYPLNPPVSRIISGTRYPLHGFAHWTSGCSGTVSFLNIVLRTINIPTEPLQGGRRFGTSGSHGQIYFSTEHFYLGHGDHLYHQFLKSVPEIPIDALFYDEEEFMSWVPMSDDLIEQRVEDITIQYLPTALLINYCADLRDNLSHREGRVASFFTTYRFEELETEEPTVNLWQRMDIKLRDLDGCLNIPNPYGITPSILMGH